MKIRSFVIAILTIAYFLPSVFAQTGGNNPAPKPDQMTIWRAHRWMVNVRSACVVVKITDETIECEAFRGRNKPRELRTLDLKSLDKLTADCRSHGFGKGKFFDCDIVTSLGKPEKHTPLSELSASSDWRYALMSDNDAVQRSRYMAECFASALNRLHEHAIHPESPLHNFPKAAADWRTRAIKPSMPEEARVHRLMAEEEVKQKHPSLALYHYEAALEIFPTWPEGFFNAAVIAAELELYAPAADHMQSYLELMPDAPDAQTARDQISVWKYKANNK